MEMTEEQLTELGITEEDLKDPTKVKELAEKFEAENKASAENEGENGDDQKGKILNDQLGRLAKAISKRVTPAEKAPEAKATLSELDVDNRVFIRSEKLSNEQVAILKEYSKLPRNEGKSFEEVYNSSAVQAELKELKAAQDVKDELDTNADEGKMLETKNEIYDKFTKTGKTPDTEYEHKVAAEKSLEASGYTEF